MLALFVVSQGCCRARARAASTNALLPYPTVRSDGALLTKIGRKVVTLECFLERTTPGHLWATSRPSMLNPASKKLARHPIQGHACDMTGPA